MKKPSLKSPEVRINGWMHTREATLSSSLYQLREMRKNSQNISYYILDTKIQS